MVRKYISDLEQYAYHAILKMKARVSNKVVDKPFETVDLPLNIFHIRLKCGFCQYKERKKYFLLM